MPGLAYREADGTARVNGGPQAADLADLPALRWPDGVRCGGTITIITASTRRPSGPGAEIEASRGCPYHCTFCAKENFRDRYRRRAAGRRSSTSSTGCMAQGVEYVYFIDEIFLPNRAAARGAGGPRG